MPRHISSAPIGPTCLKRWYTLLLLLCLVSNLPSAVIAGGSYRFSPLAGAGPKLRVDGDPSHATFAYLVAITRDGAGNLYAADANNHSIRKISVDGTVSTYVGDAATGAAITLRLENPAALAFEPDGNLLVADMNVLWRITPSGNATILLNGVHANCLAVAPDGTIYIGEGGFVARVGKIAPDGSYSVLAGDAPETGRRDGTGTEARFNWIAGLAIGRDGTLYASDGNASNSIRRVTATGVVTTFFDFGTDFVGPGALAFDSQGNLFVACWAEATIVVIDPAGRKHLYAGAYGGVDYVEPGIPVAHFGSSQNDIWYSTVESVINYKWQTGYADGFTLARVESTPGASITQDSAQLQAPSGLVFDPDNNLYVTDQINNDVRRITTEGFVTRIAGVPGGLGWRDGPGADARFYGPQGIAVDGSGNVYVAEEKNETVRKIAPGGMVTTVAGTPGRSGHKDATFSSGPTPVRSAAYRVVAERTGDASANARTRLNTPYAVAVGPQGQVYISELGSPGLRVLSRDGLQTVIWLPQNSTISGLTCDKAGNIYASDVMNYVVWKITPQGRASILAGAWGQSGFADGVSANARFSYLWIGIAVDDSGNVFVSDTGNSAVRKITPQGVVTTLAGGHEGNADGVGAGAQFISPAGLALDGEGNVYVTSARKIRKITPAGVVTTVPGTPLPTDDPRFDNGGGQIGSEGWLRGLAIDTTGNLFVVDPYNSRIVRGQYLPASRLTNVSIRALNGTGENSLIAGFVARGSDTEKVLIRGVGPTLTRYSVEHPDPNPELLVWNSDNTLRDRNDDWSDTLADVFQSVGAFDLPSGSKDAALVATLPEGGYTAQIAGSQSGTALVEAYELEPNSRSKLINVSGRVRMGADEANALVAGFTVSAGAPKQVLIRGVGPGLRPYGVSTVVTAPELTVINQATNQVLSKTRSWGGSALLADLFGRLGAFPLPNDSSDAAVLITLEPGSYTARLTNADGTTGVGLVEVFDAD